MMNLTRVKSSNLRAVGYGDGELIVEFHGGKRYRYLGVPEETHRALLAATSIGRFFRQHVRSRFDYEEILATE